MKMNTANIILSVFFIVFGIVILILTPLQVTAVSSSFNGMVPQSFPKFVGWFTIAAGLCQLVDSIIRVLHNREDEVMEKRDKKKEGKVLIIFLLLVVYTMLIDVIGFALASVAFVCAFLAILNVKNWIHYAIAIAASLIIFYCFRYLLFIHLPRIGFWIF